nr:MAG TPA: hypothetical protein [Herelleviridae sp.]
MFLLNFYIVCTILEIVYHINKNCFYQKREGVLSFFCCIWFYLYFCDMEKQ